MTSGAGPAQCPEGRPKSLWNGCPSTPVWDHTAGTENTCKGAQTKVTQLELHQRSTSKTWKSRVRSTSSSFLRWSGGHHLIHGGRRTFPEGCYGFPRNMPLIREVKLFTHFYNSSERRPTQFFLEKMEPFHDGQAATSFHVPLPQCSKHSSLPIFPRKAEVGFPR